MERDSFFQPGASVAAVLLAACCVCWASLPPHPIAQSLTVFDYRVDEATASMVPWSTVLQPYQVPPGAPFASLYVPTAETVGLQFLVDRLQANRHCVMLVGGTGTAA